MKVSSFVLLFVSLFVFSFCSQKSKKVEQALSVIEEQIGSKPHFTRESVKIEKQFLYNEHTLTDTFPYKDTVRMFQWEKIHESLYFLDSIQLEPNVWAILQNKKNTNGRAPAIKNPVTNDYKRVADTFGVEQDQAIPLYLPSDSTIAERYGRDGSLVKYHKDTGSFAEVSTVYVKGNWLVPKKYIKQISDTVIFKKAIFVDRTNQIAATLEKVDSIWFVRSMNPVTTGLHHPPFQQATPLGIFVVQAKTPKMVFYKDGTTTVGGFAPYASRFSNGGYLHGVPINEPNTNTVEFSTTLGTTPRSHMCVRNATSHAKFIYNWATTEQTLVFVFD